MAWARIPRYRKGMHRRTNALLCQHACVARFACLAFLVLPLTTSVAPAAAEEAPVEPSAKSANMTNGRVAVVSHAPPGAVPSLGPSVAPVTVEFFADLSDHRRSSGALKLIYELANRHPRRLRVLFRLVKGQRTGSDELVESGIEAFTQGRFHQYLAEFYRDTGSTPSRSLLPEIAERAGLDRERFAAALADQRHAATIISNYWRKERFGLRRTPGLLVNGTLVATPRDIDGYEAIYDRAYESAQLMIGDGIRVADLYKVLLAKRVRDLKVPRLEIGLVDGEKLPSGVGSRDNGFPLGATVDYSGPHVDGPTAAPIALVVYCAPATRNCSRMSRELSSLRAAYADKLRIVLKPVDLHFEDEQADDAHRLMLAAECSDEQGLFWAFVGRLSTRTSLPNSPDEYIETVATRVGADLDKLFSCIESPSKQRETLRKVKAEARRVGVSRTPAVVLGGQLYLGALSFRQLSNLVELELAPGLLESWLGSVLDPSAR